MQALKEEVSPATFCIRQGCFVARPDIANRAEVLYATFAYSIHDSNDVFEKPTRMKAAQTHNTRTQCGK